MHQVAKDLNYSLHFWSVVDGLVDSKNRESKQANDPLESFLAIQDLKEKTITDFGEPVPIARPVQEVVPPIALGGNFGDGFHY